MNKYIKVTKKNIEVNAYVENKTKEQIANIEEKFETLAVRILAAFPLFPSAVLDEFKDNPIRIDLTTKGK